MNLSPYLNQIFQNLPNIDKRYLGLIIRNSALGVMAIVAYRVNSSLCLSFALGTVAQMTTFRLSLALDKENPRRAHDLKFILTIIKEEHPYIPYLLLLMAIITRVVSVIFCNCFIVLFGIYSGLISSLDYYRIQQINSPIKPKKIPITRL